MVSAICVWSGLEGYAADAAVSSSINYQVSEVLVVELLLKLLLMLLVSNGSTDAASV